MNLKDLVIGKIYECSDYINGEIIWFEVIYCGTDIHNRASVEILDTVSLGSYSPIIGWVSKGTNRYWSFSGLENQIRECVSAIRNDKLIKLGI